MLISSGNNQLNVGVEKINKLILIGNVGRDPEIRYTPTGQAVASFSVASNHKYRTASGEQREETEWFNCSAFGKLAETCNHYLSKGQQVYIEGRLKTRTYQRQGGETGFSLDVTVNDIQFLGGRPQAPEASDPDGQQDNLDGVGNRRDNQPAALDSDDLPF